MNRERGARFPLSASLAGAAVVVALLLGLGALPAQTRADSGPGKIAVRVLRATSEGAERLVSRLPPSPGRSERRLRHPGLGCARVVRLQDAEEVRALARSRRSSDCSPAAASRIRRSGPRTQSSSRAAERSWTPSPRGPDVKAIESNAGSRWIPAGDRSTRKRAAPASPSVVELGVSSVNAPQLWALGFTGQGIVIANAGHRRALDAHDSEEPLPRLERHHRESQLQLVGRHPLRASVIPAETTRPLRVTTTATAPIRPGRKWGTTAASIKSAWLPERSGWPAGTWTRGTARRRRMPSAFSS